MVKLVLEKAEEPQIKLPTSWKKQESSRKTISALLTMPKLLTVWITINCEKFSEKNGQKKRKNILPQRVYRWQISIQKDVQHVAFREMYIKITIIYHYMIIYAKAFGCVDHNKLWKTLKQMRMPDHQTCLLRNLYAGQEATVRTGHGTTDWFQIGKGVCQG